MKRSLKKRLQTYGLTVVVFVVLFVVYFGFKIAVHLITEKTIDTFNPPEPLPSLPWAAAPEDPAPQKIPPSIVPEPKRTGGNTRP